MLTFIEHLSFGLDEKVSFINYYQEVLNSVHNDFLESLIFPPHIIFI